MQGFALNNISDCYVGSNQASAIYLGSTLIWPTTPPPHDYSHDYLTFEAVTPASFTFEENDLQYSLDDGSTWTTLTAGNSTPLLSVGDKILWKQTGLIPTQNVGIGTFSQNLQYYPGQYKVYGNIMSLLFGDNFIGQTSLSGYNNVFTGLFYNNYITDASNLILPATTLANSCYSGMFFECISLINPPALPATTLADNCYSKMFEDCYNLTTAPALPATTLAQSCYEYMFSDCHSLTTAPELPATTLAVQCYGAMFEGCSSLVTAPELPATTLAASCYGGMFRSCSSLVTAPELPATTLMFGCYNVMFYNCTSLTTAPILPATTLKDYCYANMFSGCTHLNYIKCLATDISASSCIYDWVQNVAASGTFVKDANTTWPTGVSGIPSGWTTQNA